MQKLLVIIMLGLAPLLAGAHGGIDHSKRESSSATADKKAAPANAPANTAKTGNTVPTDAVTGKSAGKPAPANGNGAEKQPAEKPAGKTSVKESPVKETSVKETPSENTASEKKEPLGEGAAIVEKSDNASVTMRDFSFSKFSTLHPVIVHIPVTLIPLAMILFLLGMIVRKEEYKKTGAGLTVVGLAGGFLAAFPFHPHTTKLPDPIFNTLAKHDLFAYATLIIAAVAAVFAILACLPRLRNRIVETLALLLLLAATVTVSITGHYGGTLTHVHGVGPQGKYLEKGH